MQVRAVIEFRRERHFNPSVELFRTVESIVNKYSGLYGEIQTREREKGETEKFGFGKTGWHAVGSTTSGGGGSGSSLHRTPEEHTHLRSKPTTPAQRRGDGGYGVAAGAPRSGLSSGVMSPINSSERIDGGNDDGGGPVFDPSEDGEMVSGRVHVSVRMRGPDGGPAASALQWDCQSQQVSAPATDPHSNPDPFCGSTSERGGF